MKKQRCANCISASERCKECELEISRDTDLEDENRLDLEDERHLLHGIIHVNGFGHLLRVNGREGGSRYLSGCDIMGLWDRICIMLKARKISVMDVSKKYGLDYRLLHAVQKGHPWYGNWGYEFGRGSFGTTHETYKTALQCLSKLRLDLVLSGVGGFDQELKQIVSFYRSLSKNPLVTVQDLVCFIMQLLHKFHNHTETKCSGNIMINKESTESKWAPKVVDEITAAMLKVLQVADGTMWITWHDLRGAICHGRDPQLLNYALMGLEGKTIGKQIVQCQCNSLTRTLEYRLTDRSNVSIDLKSATDPKQLKEAHVLEDLKTLYHVLLHPPSQPPPTTDHSPLHHVLISGSLHYGLEEEIWCYGLKEQLWRYGLRKQLTNASRNLMDCKQFIKNYEAKHRMITDSESIRVFVVAEILNGAQSLQKTPPELLIMPKNATIADLKQEAAQAFRDVYICFKGFHVQSVRELQNIKDSTNLMLLIGPESVVTVRGYCSGDISKYRAERGTQVWTVSCPCGTREDDGERMIACDKCEVWQHTRCIGISDSEDVPPEYMCEDCNDNSLEVDVDSDHSLPGSSSVSTFY